MLAGRALGRQACPAERAGQGSQDEPEISAGLLLLHLLR